MNITRFETHGRPIPKGSTTPVHRHQVRWRDPSGRQRAKSFSKAIDARNFVQQFGADELTGVTIDPDAGRETVERFAGCTHR